MRSVGFHPEAEAEFIAAARYYESQAENLGFDFIAAVEATYQRLACFLRAVARSGLGSGASSFSGFPTA